MQVPSDPRHGSPDEGAFVAIGAPGEISEHRDDIFFAAIETTRMPMLVTDPRRPDNPVVFANRAFLAMSGYRADEVVGRNCRFLQGVGTDPGTITTLREAIAARSEVTVEMLNYRKDGSSFWNALYVSPVFNRRGELVYFFASQLDVSRRRDAEEALAQAQKMEALGQLTGGISHDFNNILQVVSGQLELMSLKQRRGQLSAADLEAGIHHVRGAVRKATTLTQQLLAFSRKQQLRGRVVNLNAIVQNLRPLLRSAVPAQVELRLDLAPHVANCSVDPTQLEMALLNLISNSRDAITGSGEICIRTSSEPPSALLEGDEAGDVPAGAWATVTISDTGSGIPMDILPRVTEPFFTTKDEGKGTGLGLSMVYGFAKQSAGVVGISSQPGRGTDVRLHFPVVDEPSTEPATTIVAPLRGGHERVLVVDDRPDVARLAERMLRELGYEVRTTTSASEAIALVDTLPAPARPELLFTDIVMPGAINGYALARELKRRIPLLEVLLTTGFERDRDAQEHVVPGEFEVLRKPYEISELARKVRMALDGATGAKMG